MKKIFYYFIVSLYLTNVHSAQQQQQQQQQLNTELYYVQILTNDNLIQKELVCLALSKVCISYYGDYDYQSQQLKETYPNPIILNNIQARKLKDRTIRLKLKQRDLSETNPKYKFDKTKYELIF